MRYQKCQKQAEAKRDEHLLLSIGTDGLLHTSIYDKCDDVKSNITIFPSLRSSILSLSAFDVFIWQLIRCAQTCSAYTCTFLFWMARVFLMSDSKKKTSWKAWLRHCMDNLGFYKTIRGTFSILSIRCQSKKYNTDLHRMYHISSNKSPWWCEQISSCFHRP